MLKIIQHRKIWFIISGSLCLLSILSLIFWGLKPAIDFTGGTLMEIEFSQVSRPSVNEIKEALSPLNLGDLRIQYFGDKGVLFRLKNIDEDTHQKILKSLEDKFGSKDKKVIEEKRFESIGPIIGKELSNKAKWAITLVVIMIIVYVAWAFRRVSKPVSSWKYGFAAIVALVHDILITTGIFSVLGHFLNVEIDILFITALLTILGYSVNDTIVVFDRTRENLHRHPEEGFDEVVNRSVNETIVRSINTSLTTLFVLLSVFFLGGRTIRYFVLALIFGVIFGTYSSIFIASPLLVTWEKLRRRKQFKR